MRLYKDLAWVWSEITPTDTYIEEANNLAEILEDVLAKKPSKIIELGSGGGYLMEAYSKLFPSVDITLVDSSGAMLAESIKRNPMLRHIDADMTTLDLSEQFDLVLIHDAVMYLQDVETISRTLVNARKMLRSGGVIILVPDVCKESFQERKVSSEIYGKRAAIHLTEWHWDPDPLDDQIEVVFSILFREFGGSAIENVTESHTMVVLSIHQWMQIFEKAKLGQEWPSIPWVGGGEFFILRPF